VVGLICWPNAGPASRSAKSATANRRIMSNLLLLGGPERLTA
jgi:hypothetical protein